MQKKYLVFSCGLLLTLFLLNTQPTSAQVVPYSQEVTPTAYMSPQISWRVKNVSIEPVEYGFGSGTFWSVSENQHLIFNIQKIADNEVHGIFTIGNLTLPANDSRIAGELVFSIWPWFPGLVSHLDWMMVDQDAINAATGFMEGELEILTSATTKTYTYHQGAWGNQNTSLTYELRSGILLEGYTEFFFLNDYHLGIEFAGTTWNLTSAFYFVIIFILVICLTSISLIITSYRSRKE